MEKVTAEITFIKIALGSLVGNPNETDRQNYLLSELDSFDGTLRKQFKAYVRLSEPELKQAMAKLEDLQLELKREKNLLQEEKVELQRMERLLQEEKVKQLGSSAAALHHYHCRLLHARHLKCFRANIYKIAEDNLAFVRDVEGLVDGIKCDSYDIEIDLLFEERSLMLKFQSALLRLAGNTTSNKKPKLQEDDDYAEEEEEEEEENDAEDQKHENVYDIQIHEQTLASISPVKAKRLFYHDYVHNPADEAPNSPPCDTFSEAGSMSIYEPQTVTISIEKVGQMIENHNHSFFNGKNPEIAHIKDKAKSTPSELKDENNYLYLSRVLHEAFDGINTQPSGFPWFLIHYVSHREQSLDHGALQQVFGNDLNVYDRTKRYHITDVHIEFYNLTQANIYFPYLRNGCRRVDPADPLKIHMELYFSEPLKAKKYLDWKEKRTRAKWGR